MNYRLLHKLILLPILFLGLSPLLLAQNDDKQKPNQLDVLKVNLTQIAVNEVRVLYEMELRPATSLEIGLGYIYPNRLWFAQGDTPTLATGGGVYFGFRKYRTAKRFFSTPFMRSYFSPVVFARYSTYEREWLLFQGPSAQLSECAQFSERITQLGTAIRFGGQTTQGRFVLDAYTGIGVKYMPSRVTQHALNEMTEACEVLPTTDLTEIVTNTSEVQVIFNLGLKIGLRRDNRDRNYDDKGVEEPTDTEGENPPIFKP